MSGRKWQAAELIATVTAELGIAPMSLYNYVPTKDHLIQLIIDRAFRSCRRAQCRH